MAAIKATFSDFKLIKTRKVAQLVMEIPVEQADAALKALGGLPQFSTEQWVGIAPINESVPGKPKAPKSRAQMAAIIGQDQSFWGFAGTHGVHESAVFIREHCGVASRSDIKEGTEAAGKWDILRTEFDAHTGRIARPE